MNRVFPKPGDLILVTRSEWYALKDGEWLRVCEKPGWMKAGETDYSRVAWEMWEK